MAKLTRAERFKDARVVYNHNGKQSLDEVAAATSVSKSLIHSLESDTERSVGYDKIAALAKHYNVSSDYLLGLTDDPNLHPSAVDDLSLSPHAVKAIKDSNCLVSPSIEGLNSILEYPAIKELLGLVGFLSHDIQAQLEAMEKYEPQDCERQYPTQSNGACYKWQEALYASKAEQAISRNHSGGCDRFSVVSKNKMIHVNMMELMDYTKNMIYEITGYNKFLEAERD